MRRVCLAVMALIAGVPAVASAHARSVSYSRIYARSDGATIQLRMRALDRNALGVYLRRAGLSVERYVVGALQLHSRAGACVADPSAVTRLTSAKGWLRYEWHVHCDDAPVRLRSDVLVDVVSAHMHMGRIDMPGRAPLDYVFTEDTRSVAIGDAAVAHSLPATVLRYARLGIGHLLSGYDHLVFLLLLVLAAGSLRELAGIASGFTLGHSLSLAMAVTGFATPRAGLVEALIGLSIVIVAVENVWLGEQRRSLAIPGVAVAGVLACTLWAPGVALALFGVALFVAAYFGLLSRADSPVRLRLLVAGLFGLIHGFGFAGAIVALSPSTDHLAAALAGFNLGIEVAQLGVLVLAWPVVVMLRRRPGAHLWCVQAGSAAAAAVGFVWFLTRV